ncbi:MAG: VCBS repeat-containing protein [Bacteroidota bacterium]
MRLLFFLLLLLPTLTWGQSFSAENWAYSAIDSQKQKWGDWAEPDWLRYFGLDAGDLDGDGDLDIVSGRYLYHNPGTGKVGNWQRTALEENVDGIFSIDVDGDEYADIIAQALPDIYWYEAIDQAGTRFVRSRVATVPATSHVNSQGFEKADIIKGAKQELLIAGNGNVYCIRIPEEPSSPESWPTHLIGANTSDEGIGTGDIDGDGDIDIVCGRRDAGEDEPKLLMWFENPGSVITAWNAHLVGETDHPIDRIELADLNGDGKLEIVMAEERYPGLEPDGALLFFSAAQNVHLPWDKHLIARQYSSNNLDLADIDQDGDIDLLTGEHKGPNLELQLWENDGKASFQKHIIDQGKENHLGTQFYDLDGDGDLDIIGAAWDNYRFMHVWYNQRNNSSKNVNPDLSFREAVYQNATHIVVYTPSLTYYYDKAGGGFSRIIDRAGNDWLAFKKEPWGEYPASAASAFRGLPNLVFQGEDDGAGHPGHQKCKSWIAGEKIITESLSGKWRWSWQFGRDYAQLDIERTDPARKYWFLYEGTPHGRYRPAETYFGTNLSGPAPADYDFYKGNLYQASFQWMYAGTKGKAGVFYMLQLETDDQLDLISMLGDTGEQSSKDGMTVWGFGRDADTNPLLSGPQQFIIGIFPKAILDSTQHQSFARYLEHRFLTPSK